MLLSPFSLQDLNLTSRVVMAPMTRCAATEEHVPTQCMVQYYRERASMGLVIAEATAISLSGRAYPCTPGLFTEQQVEGWGAVTDAVHAEGGKIFVQLWHAGMMSHSYFLDGDLPLSPSGVRPLRETVPRCALRYETPRIMEAHDFEAVLNQFKKAAKRAVDAGFDGIELHGASGYLLDSFLHHHTNQRTDAYGREKVRFILDVIDGVLPIIRTAIRLSPAPLAGMQNMVYDPRDLDVFRDLLAQLEARELAYVHVATDEDFHPEIGCVTQFVRRHYRGTLIGGGGYTPKRARAAVENEEMDLVSFGRLALANPNLIELIEQEIDPRPFSYELVENPPSLMPGGTSSLSRQSVPLNL